MTHDDFMRRCIELAGKGLGRVAPNPLVGALLVHDNVIIGEGYHQKYGEAHAEPNCITSVAGNNKHLISRSTLYVSLEPCVHFGKTPPCADLIIEKKIPRVVIGCRDPFKEVNGKGIGKLQSAGIKVEYGILEKECIEMNKRFFTFHTRQRPFIILKWAQTANGKIAGEGDERLYITNDFSNRLVHKWRSEEVAILAGTNTILSDDPDLTTRLWAGSNPIRLVVDMNLRLPSSLKIFNDKSKTVVLNKARDGEEGNILFFRLQGGSSPVQEITRALYDLKIQSVIIEGGAKLLQSFIDEGNWDEARIITNEELFVPNGLSAPTLTLSKKVEQQKILGDKLEIFRSAP